MGANITLDKTDAVVRVNIFSGPRKLETTPVTFTFDLMITPSHYLNLSRHWDSRYMQIGYGGLGFDNPCHFKAEGVNVLTLHQGIGGIHNGTMVNPS